MNYDLQGNLNYLFFGIAQDIFIIHFKSQICSFTSGRLFHYTMAMREVEKGEISLEIYLKHELSHVLIFQHKGILAGFMYPKWLLEGIAVFSSDQMGIILSG